MKELDDVKAAKDSEIARKDRETSGLVAAAEKPQTRVQDLKEENVTLSEFCSTLEETRDSCRATIKLSQEQLAEQEGFVLFTWSARLQGWNACCRLHSIARAGLSCLR